MAWDWEKATEAKPSGVYHSMPLAELLKPDKATTDLEHIHACAIECLELAEDEWQAYIMDYIIKHERKCHAFMLNDVPMYALGYKRGCNDGFKECEEGNG